MRLNLICFGKLRGCLKEGVEAYSEKIKHYTPFSIIELRALCLDRQDRPYITNSEKARLLRHLSGCFNIFLSEKGRCFTSHGFARFLEGLLLQNVNRINFVIGGPYGLPEELLNNADILLSLSSFTFPHELSRLLLLEQIYRAFTILKGEPYSH